MLIAFTLIPGRGVVKGSDAYFSEKTRACGFFAAQRIKRASTVQDEHVAAPGLLGRVMGAIARACGLYGAH
jgi:hypothetical protein